MDISILCLVYNHEKYIRKALEGFLMQQGKFDYEILIYDDASSDGTVEILKEYKRKYPNRITLVLQKENQYSKGIKGLKLFQKYLYPLAKGKYMAFCEGDDFWIYDKKLQKQYVFMEENPNISLCCHNALIYQKESDTLKLNVQAHPSGYIEDRDVINATKGWYPTASILFRSDYIREQPDFCIPTGDEVLRSYMACRGDLYYMNRAWCVYREFSDGGWNTRYFQNKELAKRHFRDIVEYLKAFNVYSKGRFEKYYKQRLFLGIDKYKDAHYGRECSVEALRSCLNDLKNPSEPKVNAVLEEYYLLNAIKCKDYYKVTIEEQFSGEDEIYIYGAGIEAIKALIELDKYGLAPRGFIISDERNSPTELLGNPVIGLEEFKFDKSKRIWLCLINGRQDVIVTLRNKERCQIVV